MFLEASEAVRKQEVDVLMPEVDVSAFVWNPFFLLS